MYSGGLIKEQKSHLITASACVIVLQMNVQKALDKLSEWNTAGKKLKQHVPVDDKVLQSWLSLVEEFSQDVPFFVQLSSDALKVTRF